MGLNFRDSDVSWSYSGFNDFRRRLAASIGIDLDEMERFGGDQPWSTVDDPIVPFLDHSDCEGELTPEECLQVAPRLREIVTAWETESAANWDRSQALELADDMERLGKSGRPLEFT